MQKCWKKNISMNKRDKDKNFELNCVEEVKKIISSTVVKQNIKMTAEQKQTKAEILKK